MLYLENYMINDDVGDAINRAMAISIAKRLDTIQIPVGLFEVKTPIAPIPRGIKFRGTGAVGSNEATGTVLVKKYVGDLFHWNGAADFYGTGGGLENMLLLTDVEGGCAIKLSTKDNARRPGFMHFRDLIIPSFGNRKSFNFGIYCDNDLVDVRDLTFSNVNVFGCNQNALFFNNVTHAYFFAFQTGNGLTGRGDVFMSSSVDISFSSCAIWGSLKLGTCTSFNYQGYVSGLISANTEGLALLSKKPNPFNIDSRLRVLLP